MPEFVMNDARPAFRITINFMTPEDVVDFARQINDRTITTRTDSAWYPKQSKLGGHLEYRGPQTDSRYPVCIPSKGRAGSQMVGKQLRRLGVTHYFFVEETEYDAYCRHVGSDRVVKLPFADLGEGSIPARNFIWDWAAERGYRRHWVVDDNIRAFARCHNNRRLNVRGGGFFAAMEDFVDRYKNVAAAGPHDKAFVPDRNPNLTPYLLNSRIYSCILLDTDLPFRWRGRYNEDTDLSLRFLKAGYCTILFRALLMDKAPTYYGNGDRSAALAGGNTDTVYAADDYRLKFAEALARLHPDVVKVVWKFNRWHHEVDYSPFVKNQLQPREGIIRTESNDDYGMTLCRVR
jgi:hypothetical protein